MKISNSCWKATFLSNTTNKEKYEEQLKIFRQNYLKAEHGLKEAQFFHLYAKKRIVVEKQFSPINDLYEFKFFILNKDIKLIYLMFYVNKKVTILF